MKKYSIIEDQSNIVLWDLLYYLRSNAHNKVNDFHNNEKIRSSLWIKLVIDYEYLQKNIIYYIMK